MNTRKIITGIVILLLAIGILLDAFGVLAPLKEKIGDISLFALLVAVGLVLYAFSRLLKGKIADIFVPLALAFMVLEENIAVLLQRADTNLINNWLLLGCAILMQIGVAMLFSGSSFHVVINKDGKSNFSNSIQYVNGADFIHEEFENSLGSLVIRFENAEQYQGGGVLVVENDLGSCIIEVPSIWRVKADVDNSLGVVRIPEQHASAEAPLLMIKCENSLGSVTVKYV